MAKFRCKRCRCSTEHYRPSVSHALHLILTLLTCVWGMVWLWFLVFTPQWRCANCGK